METCVRVMSIATFNVEIETEINMSEEEFEKLDVREQQKLITENTCFQSQTEWIEHDHWKERLDNVDVQDNWTVNINNGLPTED